MSASINFILGNDKDIDPMRQYQGIVHIPKVGDYVSLSSTRSDDGSYVHKTPKKLFEGTVTKIEYSINEYGSDASSHHLTQIISVYLNP